MPVALRMTHERVTLLVFGMAVAVTSNVWAAGPLPSGGRFVAGAGQLSWNGSSLTIAQTTPRAVIDWCNFSIDRDHSVAVQNGAGTTLSRVTGGEKSLINGALTASGSFYLINPQGVVIGANGVVTTGGRFVASTLDVSNDAFMAGGPLNLTGNGEGVVVNLGKIISTGGDVLLIARKHVENDGAIIAPAGSVELSAGDHVSLRDSASLPHTFVQTTGSRGDVVDKGTISAAQVALQAADGNVFALAGRHSGVRATGTDTRDGHVWLVAENGTVHAHGMVNVSNADGRGGTADITAGTTHLDGLRVQAGQWDLTENAFVSTIQSAAALEFALSRGASVKVVATGRGGASGDIVLQSTLRWNGKASLELNAARSVAIGANATIANRGAGNLSLRADDSGNDNGGSVTNAGLIDWSKSSGLVSMYYDQNGTHAPGMVKTNPGWAARPYSAVKNQIMSYRLVNSIADLQRVSSDLTGSYALGRDIDATKGELFVPIGNGGSSGADRPFTGELDGNGHVIRNLDIRMDFHGRLAAAGLFADIGPSGVVRNLGVLDAMASALFYPAGIIAAINGGVISSSYTTGTVQVFDYSGEAGGLVARNSGTIERSWSSAGVGSAGSAGGLAVTNSGTIAQSFFSGSVGTSIHGSPGGLVENNSGVIDQSYSTGDVNRGAYPNAVAAGGLVSANGGTITESFSASHMTKAYVPEGVPPSAFPFGGVASYNGGVIANNVFWDVDTTQAPVGVYNGTQMPAANGLTTAQMSRYESFGPSWDFRPGGAWIIPAGASHPILRWQLDTQHAQSPGM
ncbi:two-partner secretion domain-containing protein [Caballeronia grimmiae]|uniref:two-partner secretion domain-containing protein n=1 Tax=Caballeronia grimmiae TaxID=1071679 RepID=UPI0038BD0266